LFWYIHSIVVNYEKSVTKKHELSEIFFFVYNNKKNSTNPFI